MTNLTQKYYLAVLGMGDAYDAVVPEGMSDEAKNLVFRLRGEATSYYDALVRGETTRDGADQLKGAIEAWQTADRTETVACAATGRVLQTILDQMLRSAIYLAWAAPLTSGEVSAQYVASLAEQPAHHAH